MKVLRDDIMLLSSHTMFNMCLVYGDVLSLSEVYIDIMLRLDVFY